MTKKLELGVFNVNGNTVQSDSRIIINVLGGTGGIKYAKPGSFKILQQYRYPGASWSKQSILDIYKVAEANKDKVDGFIPFLQEEMYRPGATPQISITTATGSAYMLEGVNIPSMPGNESAFFLAHLKAWKNFCNRLGKKAVLCGCSAECENDGIWNYLYTAEGVDFIAKNFDIIILYHYPSTVAQAQGASCTNKYNNQTGLRNAKSYIDFWRKKGYNGKILYLLVTKFANGVGTTNLDVIKADFKDAADNLWDGDGIITYPYTVEEKDNLAVKRMLDISDWYGGIAPPEPPIPPVPVPVDTPTIVLIGDSHTNDFSNGVTELTKDLNNIVSQSPTGKVDAIFALGDMETVTKWNEAHKASTAKDIPAYSIVGNHDVVDIAKIKALRPTKYPIRPGLPGTSETTYSLNIGELHIIVVNEYWDGKTNEGWIGGGIDGGEIGDALRKWISEDIISTDSMYIAVLGHEPAYPDKRHIGNSLDWNKASRDAFQNMLNSLGADIYGSGHTHFASVSQHGTVAHIQAGVSGAKAGDNGDSFSSMFFIHILGNGYLRITHKHDNNNSWANPTVHTWDLPQSNIPEPTEKWVCNIPLDGTAISNLGNTRPDPNCNPVPVPVGDNLVKNPSFEESIVTVENWDLNILNDNYPTVDSSVKHSGSHSIKIHIPGTVNKNSGYPESDLIKVDPLSKYVVSVWGKTENCGGSNTPAARVLEYDKDMIQLKQTNILPVFGRGTNDWVKRSIELKTTATTAFITIYANIWQGYGTFWIDDVEVRKVQ